MLKERYRNNFKSVEQDLNLNQYHLKFTENKNIFPVWLSNRMRKKNLAHSKTHGI